MCLSPSTSASISASTCSSSLSLSPMPETRCSLEDLLGDTLLCKGVSTGIISTAKIISGCRVVALFLSCRRSSSCLSFVPVLRSFYSHALRETGNRFELVGVGMDRLEAEFDVNFFNVAVCWPAVLYGKARCLGDKLRRELGLRHLPSLVVIDTVTGEVMTAHGAKAVIAAMKSEEPDRAVRDLLSSWGMETVKDDADLSRKERRPKKQRWWGVLSPVKQAVRRH
ncbi:unnamed protein product [Chrysoparadoxa australica]